MEKQIKLAVFDFDGVFTNCDVSFDCNGHVTKTYNVRDGTGINMLRNKGIEIGVISGYKENRSQRHILTHLGIKYVSLNDKTKIHTLQRWCSDLNIDLKTEVSYMGDDTNDLEIMKHIDKIGCPLDAVTEVKKVCCFHSTKEGGKGCVREFCEHIIEYNNRIESNQQSASLEIVYQDESLTDIESRKTNIEKVIRKDYKVLILASDIDLKSERIYTNNITYLEHSIRVLLLTGLKSKNIYVISREDLRETIEDLNCNFINISVSMRSGTSLILGLKKIKDYKDGLILIHGNINFDVKQIDILLNSKENCILSNTITNSEINGTFIKTKNNMFSGIHTNKNEVTEFKIYSGISYFDESSIDIIKNMDYNTLTTDINLLENLLSFDKEIRVYDFNYEVSSSIDMIGGSFAGLDKLCIVRKYAKNEAKNKLIKEIQWIINLEDSIKSKFPNVLSYKEDKNECYYDMEYYNYPSFRKLIMLNVLSLDKIKKIISSIITFMFEKLYTIDINSTPQNWLKEKHFDRVLTRLDEIRDINPILSNFTDVEHVIVNGIPLKNIRYFMNKIMSNEEFLNIVKPDKMVKIHGDLHFQNILIKDVDQCDFILLDPRGENDGSDIYYDIGKLFHSFNGLYDFIHTDQLQLTYDIENPSIDFILGDKKLREVYNQIMIHSIFELEKQIPDEYLILRAKFTEIMHFSSLFIFHVKNDNIETRALALYATSLCLIAQFMEEYSQFF